MLRFRPGQVYMTPGVMAAAEASGDYLLAFLLQHIAGDWGVIDAEDKQANEDALANGNRLLSAYLLKDRTRIWIITEAVGERGVREVTTLLLPSEY